ncbi:bifunctional 4-hydroxy-2-oxoglutarate aldolase/2-dehydro-3-deoxy-phosphogluconate aldolase [Arthrobacter psychrochitiniphilus]|uniref:bifunctional 4-hydroxy-2-oxoglutarate aldolase/2-dehydro-3-deoxy-phosphogluconate aldolase n=1 Tax=Arthrobacter psychrochitiniphilus TaxID=291045 RepID=UPI003F7CA8BD
MTNKILQQIGALGIVPVIEIEDAKQAVDLAAALIEGGLPVMEITLRTEAGLSAISAIAEAFPDFLLGAGSLLTPAQVTEVAARGAKFGVSPGHSQLLLDAAAQAQLPFIPGAVTPSEVISALEAGCTTVKFFPAEAFGGTKTIKSLAAPFATAGIKIMPTGGVTLSNLKDYLAIPEVLAVGGSWIATREQIRNSNFAQISSAAREAVSLVSSLSKNH